MAEHVAGHFENLQRQAHAAHLGMWVFLGSEILFFAGLFALYAGYRAEHPYGFGLGVQHNTIVYGSVNTAVLLVSSFTIALAVHELRRGAMKRSLLLIAATVFLGLCFLCVKAAEYLHHFDEGIYPGGVGHFFKEHSEAGTKMFFTLYFAMTGLHAIHVFVGLCVLGVLGRLVATGRISPGASHPLAVGAIYWHLVDVIWIFLWPLFYLIPGRRPLSEQAQETTAGALVATLFALLVLAALSLVLSRLDLGGWNYPVALGIAVVKAVLVAVFFMEFLHETAATHLAIAACLTLLALLLALLLADIVTRTVPPLEPPPGNAQRVRG